MKTNIYKCYPCPKCSSPYRAPWPVKEDITLIVVRCDDCGFKERSVYSKVVKAWVASL